MKTNLVQALILILLSGLVIPSYLALPLMSHEKMKARKIASSLQQQSQAKDLKQKGAQENKGSKSEQEGKGRVADTEIDTIRIETTLAVFDVLVLAPNGSAVPSFRAGACYNFLMKSN
jgi:hypothetical protein